jgi:hypothetical protein
MVNIMSTAVNQNVKIDENLTLEMIEKIYRFILEVERNGIVLIKRGLTSKDAGRPDHRDL